MLNSVIISGITNFYSPLESNLLTDSTLTLFFGTVTLEVSSAVFGALGSFIFSMYLIFFDLEGNLYDTDEDVEEPFTDGLSGLLDEILEETSDTLVTEENIDWSSSAFGTICAYVAFVNVSGLFPWGSSTNMLISAVLILTWSIYLGINILGISLNKFNTFLLFLATGASIIIQKVLWVIEIFSYLLRAVTLGIRIYANLLAGHSLVHILLSGTWYFLLSGSLFLVSIQSILVLFICFLELGVGIVQAYVLSILVSLYLGEHTYRIINH